MTKVPKCSIKNEQGKTKKIQTRTIKKETENITQAEYKMGQKPTFQQYTAKATVYAFK